MNVFGSIKQTISKVPQNISAGLKHLTSREDDQPEKLSCDGVSVDAGAELLNKFQECWSQIHDDAEINAKKAEDVDGHINKMYLEIERQNDTMNEFLTHVTYLPELVLSLEATMELIGELEGKVSDLESNLLTLEDVCEDYDMQNNRSLHLNELKLYRERKAVEIEQVKAKLAREHADRAAAHESKLQATLQEKQAIFEGTYTEAMQDYKLFGASRLNTPGYRNPSSSSNAGPDLSSITLDQDTADLDAFLATDTEQTDSDQPTTDTELPKEPAESDSKDSGAQVVATPEAGDSSAQIETESESKTSETETREDATNTANKAGEIATGTGEGDKNKQNETGETETKTKETEKETETGNEQSNAKDNTEGNNDNNNSSESSDITKTSES